MRIGFMNESKEAAKFFIGQPPSAVRRTHLDSCYGLSAVRLTTLLALRILSHAKSPMPCCCCCRAPACG